LIVVSNGYYFFTDDGDPSLLQGVASDIRNDGVAITVVRGTATDTWKDQLLTMVGGKAEHISYLYYEFISRFSLLRRGLCPCTTTTTSTTTTTTIFRVATHYRLMAICATALAVICMCMCMVISCIQQMAEKRKACDEDVESFLPEE